MLVCYLDDSGKDSQNPIATIVASEEAHLHICCMIV
jgi:hypothetical protein